MIKLGVYTIINNPLPQLLKIKTLTVSEEDFKKDDKIINIFKNKLNIDKLDSEYVYALSLTYGLIPRGIILIGIGNNERCTSNLRGLGISLLLTGAEQFIVLHNHPGKNRNPSQGDYIMTKKYEELGETIGIEFSKHIMIAGDYFEYC